MQTTKEATKRSMIIHPYLSGNMGDMRSVKEKLAEAIDLAAAINLEIINSFAVHLASVKAATYIGAGKVKELAEIITAEKIDLVIMNCSISPIQQRNLEKSLQAKVIDRTALILEIFGDRALSREGRLQVELAYLTHQRGRLVRSWTHLERQRGGTGFLGGPGETQIESDRRMLADKIKKIKHDLETVVRTRTIHRQSRQKVPFPTVALVGYTNVGKSSLFNHLTHAKVQVADMLFATLDPTMRLMKLPSGRQIILSDTVGFISELPTELIAAFRATMEEVLFADVILHVRDCSHSETLSQKKDVENILRGLGCSLDNQDGHIIEVLNKVDLLPEAERQAAENILTDKNIMYVSAITGFGIDNLCEAIDRCFRDDRQSVCYRLLNQQSEAIGWLYAHGTVVSQQNDDEYTEICISMTPINCARFEKYFKQMPSVDIL